MKNGIIEGWIFQGEGPDKLTAIPGDGINGWAKYASVYLPEGWKHVGGNTLMTPSGEIYDLRDAAQVYIDQWVAEVGGERFEIYAEPFKIDLEAADDGECSDEEYDFVMGFFENHPQTPLEADFEIEDALRLLQDWNDTDPLKTMPRHMTAAKFTRVWNEIQAETWERFQKSELSRAAQ